MVKIHDSLEFRLVASVILLIAVTTSLTYVYTYSEAKKAIVECAQEELIELVGMASTQVDGEALEKMLFLNPGDEETEEFNESVHFLKSLRRNSRDISNIYVLKKEQDKLVFLVDDYYFDDENEAARIGEEYLDHGSTLMDAFNMIVVSPELYAERGGTFMSGYAPLKDDTGEVVAVIGVDMDVKQYKEKQDFIGESIFIVIGISVLVGAYLIFFLVNTVINDIRGLTEAANQISNGELNVSLPDIKDKNEVYELKEAIRSMLAAIDFLGKEAETGRKKSA